MMSAQGLTEQQALAITTRDASVALSAGAGCGKTFVLTERFLSYIDPAALTSRQESPIGDLVAITFTEAAAREMRGRIRAKCLQRMAQARGQTARAWWELIRRLDTARINTIHGFCRSLLAEHAFEAGLDPQFQVLDEAQAGLLRLRVVDDFLRRKLATWDPQVFQLIRDGRIETLREELLELLDQSGTHAFTHWLGRSPNDLCDAWRTMAETRVPAALARNIAHSAPAAKLRHVLDRLQGAAGELQAKCALIGTLLGEFENGRGTLAGLRELQEAAYFKDVSQKRFWPGDLADHRDAFRDALSELRTRIKGVLPNLEFDPAAALPTATDGLDLLRLADEANRAYMQEKSDRAAVDFDDLIHRTVTLLTSPGHADVLQQAQEGVFALLVDEFQDTDRRQLELVQALCGSGLKKGKLFFVGDHKQSIYRFRGAEPRVFHELAASLPEGGRQSLTTNFRSQPAILNFVNGLFVHEFGTAAYEPLIPARPQVSPTPAIEFLWTLPEDETSQTNPKSQISSQKNPKFNVEDVRRAEARSIARRLRELIDEGQPLVWDAAAAEAGTPRARPLRVGDIAILFRALSDVHLYESALREEGLDYYLVGGHAFYAQQEIRDFIHLLRAIASEADDVALAGALRSPIFALYDETLFWLVRKGGTLNEGLLCSRPIDELPQTEQQKVGRAAATLRYLRDLKDRDTVTAVVSAAIERTGYDAVVLGEFLGERKLANLEKLIEDARAADAAGNDLYALVTQLSHFVAKLPKEPLATTTSEGADVIRLMTIHHAKGLEFPLVVLPDLNRRSAGGRDSVALHPDLGPVVRPRKGKPGEGPPVVGLNLYKILEQDEEREEALRILYVGCTRAADYLILSSGFSTTEPDPTELLARVARNFDLATGRLLKPLPDEYDGPEVRVTHCPFDNAARTTTDARGKPLKHVLEQISKAGKGQQPIPAEVLPVACDVAPREFSFSRLSGHLEPAEQEPDEDTSPDEECVGESHRATTGTAREAAIALGQLAHASLEALPTTEEADVASLVARYAQTVLPPFGDDERRSLIERAETFVSRVAASHRHRAIVAARQVAREVDFLLPWPPSPSSASPRPAGARYFIRGVIDCLYQDEDGAWHILDYKTNRVTRREVAAAAKHYELQLQVYALAVERTLGVSPCELVLWFLDADAEYRVPWNEALRARCIQSVSQAIGRLLSQAVHQLEPPRGTSP